MKPALRILHLPLNTAYVRKLSLPGSFTLQNGHALPDGELLPELLTFDWLCKHAKQDDVWSAFDVLHIHFGYEFEPRARVEEALALCKSHGRAIVFTCHDVTSVHGTAQDVYSDWLALLCRASDAVLTLTFAAQRALSALLGAGAPPILVASHGYIRPPEAAPFPPERGPSAPPLLTLFGAPRANRSLEEILPPLRRRLLETGKARLRLLLRDVLWVKREAQNEEWAQRCAELAGDTGVEVIRRTYYDDEELARLLGGGDALLLPYTSGNHSGQMELALDLGLVPVATDVGFLRAQYDQVGCEEKTPALFAEPGAAGALDPERFTDAAETACALVLERAPGSPRIGPAWTAYRAEEHRRLLDTHERAYRYGMDRSGPDRGSGSRA